jgi:hypothetical protein
MHSDWIELSSSFKDAIVCIRHRYQGLLELYMTFKITVNGGDIGFILDCITTALLEHGLPKIQSLSKLTLRAYTILIGTRMEKVSFTLGKAIPLTVKQGKLHPQFMLYFTRAVSELSMKGYDSSKSLLESIIVRVYYVNGMREEESKEINQSYIEEIAYQLKKMGDISSLPRSSEECEDDDEQCAKHCIITQLSSKSKDKERQPFFVADMETLLNENDEHVPSIRYWSSQMCSKHSYQHRRYCYLVLRGPHTIY